VDGVHYIGFEVAAAVRADDRGNRAQGHMTSGLRPLMRGGRDPYGDGQKI
jgi:hypothetical protein